MSDPNTRPDFDAEPAADAAHDTAAAPAADAAPDAAAPADSEQVAKLEAEIARLKDQLLRSAAEMENTRRRAQRDREDAIKYAVAGFAKELLPVADNLRRALEAVPADGRDKDEILKSLAVGVEATERQLLAAFDRGGIKKLEPVNEVFDPNFHQVMFEIENTGKPAGTVVQVLQAGYTLNGRLLREAMVGVAKAGPDITQHIDTKA